MANDAVGTNQLVNGGVGSIDIASGAVGNTQLADNSVSKEKLKTVNAAVDGYFLKYKSIGDGFEFVPEPSAGVVSQTVTNGDTNAVSSDAVFDKLVSYVTTATTQTITGPKTFSANDNYFTGRLAVRGDLETNADGDTNFYKISETATDGLLFKRFDSNVSGAAQIPKSYSLNETGNPVDPQDLTDKEYVDAAVAGVSGGGGDMLKAENLSGLTNYATARSNLGLGSLATESAVGSPTITDGTILDVDISATAAISGSKLAFNSVPTDRIQDGAITNDKLSAAVQSSLANQTLSLSGGQNQILSISGGNSINIPNLSNQNQSTPTNSTRSITIGEFPDFANPQHLVFQSYYDQIGRFTSNSNGNGSFELFDTNNVLGGGAVWVNVLSAIAAGGGGGGGGDVKSDGSVPFTGNLSVSAAGSTPSSPRILGITDFNVTGRGARFQFGDGYNAIQNQNGESMVTQSYHTMVFNGGHNTLVEVDYTNPNFSKLLNENYRFLFDDDRKMVWKQKDAAGKTVNFLEIQKFDGTELLSIGPDGRIREDVAPAELKTGTVIDMNDHMQYNTGAASAATSYSLANIKAGGYAELLVNAPSEPTVTGATKLPNTATFLPNTNMLMVIKTIGTTTKFFFVEF